MHTGEKPFVCKYPSCGKRFSRKDNCDQHYANHLRVKQRIPNAHVTASKRVKRKISSVTADDLEQLDSPATAALLSQTSGEKLVGDDLERLSEAAKLLLAMKYRVRLEDSSQSKSQNVTELLPPSTPPASAHSSSDATPKFNQPLPTPTSIERLPHRNYFIPLPESPSLSSGTLNRQTSEAIKPVIQPKPSNPFFIPKMEPDPDKD